MNDINQMNTKQQNKTAEEIVQEFHNEDISKWRKISNVLTPPMYFIQTYETADGIRQKVRSDGLLPYPFKSITYMFEDWKKVLSIISDFDVKEITEERTVFDILYPLYSEKSHVECKHSIVTSQDEIIHVTYQYNQNMHDYYVFAVKKCNEGIQVTAQNAFFVDQLTKETHYHYINHARKFIYNVAQYFENKYESKVMLEMEKQFFRRIFQISLYPIRICANQYLSVYANEDFSEVVMKGRSKYKQNVTELVGKMFDMLNSSLIYPEYKVIKNTGKLTYFHKETPYFAHGISETDLMYSSRIVEGNIFIGCQSMKCMCPYQHKQQNDSFEVLLCAESINFITNEVLESSFYYHFRCPSIAALPTDERRLKVSILGNVLVMDRAIIENDVNPFIETILLTDNDHILAKKLLYSASKIDEQMNEKKKQRRVIVSQDEVEKKGIFQFDQLDRRLKEKIVGYLSIKDIINCMLTSRKLYTTIKQFDKLWKIKYDNAFNPLTFKRYNIEELIMNKNHPTDIENTSIESVPSNENEISYYEKVRLQGIIKYQWQKKSSLLNRRVRVFDKMSLDYVFLHANEPNTFMIGSKDGIAKKIKSDTFETMTEIIFKEKITGMGINNEVPKILFGLDNGLIRTYYNDAYNTYDTTVSTTFDGMQFVDKTYTLMGWKDNIMRICDLETKTIIQQYHGHSGRITHGDKMDKNLYITSSKDGSLIEYDDRCQNYSFRSTYLGAGIETFDGFENYVIGGMENGTIFMYDIRMNNFVVSRQFESSPITNIYCYNRKVIVGGKERMINYLDCTKGWFGNYIIMYQHQAPITCIKFDDIRLITGSSDGVMYVSDFNPYNFDL